MPTEERLNQETESTLYPNGSLAHARKMVLQQVLEVLPGTDPILDSSQCLVFAVAVLL